MSKFYFEIAVPVAEAVAKLPKRSSVVSETYEHGKVKVVWECDEVRTLYTCPVQWDGTGEPPGATRQTGQGTGASSKGDGRRAKVGAVSKLPQRAK